MSKALVNRSHADYSLAVINEAGKLLSRDGYISFGHLLQVIVVLFKNSPTLQGAGMIFFKVSDTLLYSSILLFLRDAIVAYGEHLVNYSHALSDANRSLNDGSANPPETSEFERLRRLAEGSNYDRDIRKYEADRDERKRRFLRTYRRNASLSKDLNKDHDKNDFRFD